MFNRIYLNDDWTYYRADQPEERSTVRLPHTNVELPYNYFDEKLYQFVSVYERSFFLPEEYAGKLCFLRFEGAGHMAQVYINGTLAENHYCGYTEFKVPLNQFANFGDNNTVKVVLDARESLNEPPFGHVIDYLTYGGLYREVSLEVYEKNYIADVFVKCRTVETSTKTLEVETTIHADNLTIRPFHLTYDIYDGETCIQTYSVEHVEEVNTNTLYCAGLENWDVDHPKLYELHVRLTEGQEDGTSWDFHKVTFGCRTVDFRADGFYLNGKKLKIRGLNRHQSYPYVGYAMPKSVQENDVHILKNELGLNAVRTSHYPQSQYFLDECDRAGLLVFTEAPGWQHIGNDAWKKKHLQNVKDMVLQNRNHPSIMLWGVRINESQDDNELYRKANAVAHQYDDTRPTSGVRFMQLSNLLEDVYAYNDFSHTGQNAGAQKKWMVTGRPNAPYLISEYNGHMYPTKSFDDEAHRLQHALRHANVVNAAAAPDNGISGSFGWCMADYNTHKDFGSGDKICYHGVLDMFRNPKMAAALYASQAEATNVLEISSSMDIGEWPAGKLGDVFVFTNADYVNLYKNGDFVRRFYPDTDTWPNLKHAPIRIDDLIGELLENKEGMSPEGSLAFRKAVKGFMADGVGGVLKPNLLAGLARTFVKDKLSVEKVFDLVYTYVTNWGSDATIYRFDAVKKGQVVNSITKAPMNEVILNVKVDHTNLCETSSYDVACVRIEAVSKEGNHLFYLNDPIMLQTSGCLELIGPSCVPLRGGYAGTYVKTTGKAGEGKLVISSERTEPITISFTADIEEY